MEQVVNNNYEKKVSEITNVLNDVISMIYSLDNRKSCVYINIFLEEVVVNVIESYANYYSDKKLLDKLKLANDFLTNDRTYEILKKYFLKNLNNEEILKKINNIIKNINNEDEKEEIENEIKLSPRTFLKYLKEQAYKFGYIELLDIYDEFIEKREDFKESVTYSFLEEDDEQLYKLHFN